MRSYYIYAMAFVEGVQVSQAAEELGLSEQRIRALLSSGALRGEKLAGRWFVHPESIERWRHRRDARGRPLSPDNAWGVLLAVSGLDPDWLSPWDKSRLPDRLSVGWEYWIPRLQNRAEGMASYAPPSQIQRLSADPRLVLSGVSASKGKGSGLVGRDELEAYVHKSDLKKVLNRYKLSSSSRPNVILHVVSGRWPFDKGLRSAPPAVVAIDLIESGNPRSVREGNSMMRHLMKRVN